MWVQQGCPAFSKRLWLKNVWANKISCVSTKSLDKLAAKDLPSGEHVRFDVTGAAVSSCLNEEKASLLNFFSKKDDSPRSLDSGIESKPQNWNYKNFYESLPEEIEIFQFSSPSPDDVSLLNRTSTVMVSSNKKDVFDILLDEGYAKTGSEPNQSPREHVTEQNKSVPNKFVRGPFIAGGAKKSLIIKTASILKNYDSKNQAEKPSNSTSFTSKTVTSKHENKVETRKAKIIQELEKHKKSNVNLIVIGHVDAGKSTLIGHLLYLCGEVEERVMNKCIRESKNQGKGSFKFAWILDEGDEERKRGVTIDVATKQIKIGQQVITIYDTPGHKDFVPNMISGAVQAEAAILVVDAVGTKFDSTLIANSTKEHIFLCKTFGIKQIIVAVNKLDLLVWSQEKFNMIKSTLNPILKKFNFYDSQVNFVPVSGLTGENLLELSKNPLLSSWYKDCSLIEKVKQLKPVKRHFNKPFRMTVYEVLSSKQNTVTFYGKLEFGIILTSEKAMLCPQNLTCTVKTIVQDGENVEFAAAGSGYNITLIGLRSVQLDIGDVLCDLSNPIRQSDVFVAQLITFHVETPIIRGSELLLFLNQHVEPITISELISVTVGSKARPIDKPKAIFKNSSALVEITIEKSLCIEEFKSFDAYGRFTLRDRGETVASGVVKHIGSYESFDKNAV